MYRPPVDSPELIAAVIGLALLAGGGLWWWRSRADASEAPAPPSDPARASGATAASAAPASPEGSKASRHEALGTRLFTTPGERLHEASDLSALVDELDRFTEGAMALQGHRCTAAGDHLLLALHSTGGWLRGTLEPLSGWIDPAGLLPLLNGALAHAGAERRLAVAEVVDDQRLSLAFVTYDEAETLAEEGLLSSPDGFAEVDLDATFRGPPRFGGPVGRLPGKPYTATRVAAEGGRVVAVRQGQAAVWDGVDWAPLEGMHPKADAVCVSAGDIYLADPDRNIGVWAPGEVQPGRHVALGADAGRVVALHHAGGRLAAAVRSKKADTTWVIAIDDDGTERLRLSLAYGAVLVRWSPSGSHLAVALEGGGLTVFDADGTEVMSHHEEGAPFALVWQPDGQELAAAFDERARTVRWSPDGGTRVAQHGVSALAYGPGGLTRSFLDEVVLPDGTSLPAGRQALELAWADALWATGDHGWLVEVVPA